VFYSSARYKVCSLAALLAVLIMITPEPAKADQFDAGVVAYQSGLYQQAETLWLQVKGGPNFAQSAYNLAVLYEAGLGVHATNTNVLRWYRVAAEEGLADAQFNYAGLFYQGQRTPKKIEDAIYWWSQAANQGHLQAQHNLGVLLFEGTEIPRDLNNAYQWFTLASDGGYAESSIYLERLLEELEADRAELEKSLSKADWDTHEMWLFHQDPADFTLELFRGSEFDEALSFVKANGIQTIAQFYLFGSQVIVVAGIFNTEFEAKDAMNKLSELAKTNARPRQLNAVQADLRR
jgi:hypothetical protein